MPDHRGVRRRTVTTDADTELALRFLRRSGVSASVLLREAAARALADLGCRIYDGEIVSSEVFAERVEDDVRRRIEAE